MARFFKESCICSKTSDPMKRAMLQGELLKLNQTTMAFVDWQQRSWLSTVITAVFFLILHIAPSANTTEVIGKHVSFTKNLKTSVKCACQYPQPRLVHIDELEEYHVPNAIFAPRALLIHRCDRSVGYCHAPAHVCSSVESEEENVTFHVKNLFSPLKSLVTITLRNHTRCKCAKPPRTYSTDIPMLIDEQP